MNNVLYETIRAFNDAMKINIPNISASLNIALKNFSEIAKSISDGVMMHYIISISSYCVNYIFIDIFDFLIF